MIKPKFKVTVTLEIECEKEIDYLVDKVAARAYNMDGVSNAVVIGHTREEIDHTPSPQLSFVITDEQVKDAVTLPIEQHRRSSPAFERSDSNRLFFGYNRLV